MSDLPLTAWIVIGHASITLCVRNAYRRRFADLFLLVVCPALAVTGRRSTSSTKRTIARRGACAGRVTPNFRVGATWTEIVFSGDRYGGDNCPGECLYDGRWLQARAEGHLLPKGTFDPWFGVGLGVLQAIMHGDSRTKPGLAAAGVLIVGSRRNTARSSSRLLRTTRAFHARARTVFGASPSAI